jgi:hypothetical protein
MLLFSNRALHPQFDIAILGISYLRKERSLRIEGSNYFEEGKVKENDQEK